MGPFVDELLTNVARHGDQSGASSEIRAGLAACARSFHARADAQSIVIDDAIARLVVGAPLLRVSHQPNALSALNVLTPHLLLCDIARIVEAERGIRPVVIFVVVDYDAAGDTRFRTPLLPAPSGRMHRLPSAVERPHRARIAAAAPTPSASLVASWEKALVDAVKFWTRRLRHLGLPVPPMRTAAGVAAMMLEDVATEMRRSAGLADANAAILARLLTLHWGLDVLFVHERALWPLVATQLDEVLRIALEQDGAEHGLGVWSLCAGCLRRRPADVAIAVDGAVAVDSGCESCGVAVRREPLDWSTTVPTVEAGALPRFIPRVGLSDIADLTCYGFAGSASYAGGVEHVLRSRAWARRHLSCRDAPPELAVEVSQALVPTPVSAALAAAEAVGTEAMDGFQRGRFPAQLYSAMAPDGDVPRQQRESLTELEATSGAAPAPMYAMRTTVPALPNRMHQPLGGHVGTH